MNDKEKGHRLHTETKRVLKTCERLMGSLHFKMSIISSQLFKSNSFITPGKKRVQNDRAHETSKSTVHYMSPYIHHIPTRMTSCRTLKRSYLEYIYPALFGHFERRCRVSFCRRKSPLHFQLHGKDAVRYSVN